jgi:hypothetical protein
MRLFVIFIVSLAFSALVSYLAYKLFKFDLSPTIVSLAMLIVWSLLPDHVVDRITGKK